MHLSQYTSISWLTRFLPTLSLHCSPYFTIASMELLVSVCQFICRWPSNSTTLFTREMPVGSPPHSSKRTNKFSFGLSQDRGRWYLTKCKLFCSVAMNTWKLHNITRSCSKKDYSPSLRRLSTVTGADTLVMVTSVITTATRTTSFIGRPVTTDTVSIDPRETFLHSTHI